jgi:hypothetical protein
MDEDIPPFRTGLRGAESRRGSEPAPAAAGPGVLADARLPGPEEVRPVEVEETFERTVAEGRHRREPEED